MKCKVHKNREKGMKKKEGNIKKRNEKKALNGVRKRKR